MRIWIAVSILGLLASCSAHRPPDTTKPPTVIDKAQIAKARKSGYRIVADGDRLLYCRKEVVTGSYLTKKDTCLTQSQWQQEAEASRRAIDDMSRVPAAKGPDSN